MSKLCFLIAAGLSVFMVVTSVGREALTYAMFGLMAIGSLIAIEERG